MRVGWEGRTACPRPRSGPRHPGRGHGRHHRLAAAITQHVEKHGPVQVLVNNTGGPPPGPAHLAEVDAFEEAFRLHLLANQTLVKAVLPGMQAAGHGRIINIISTSVEAAAANLG